MLSRFLRLSFVAWFALLAALLLRGASHGWSLGVGLGLGLLLFLHPALLATESFLARRVGWRCVGEDVGSPPTPTALVRAWLGEWRASTLVFGWRLPWRANAVADHLPAGALGRRGVVFVHGFICNRGIWNGWLARLRALDRAFVAVTLEPVFGSIDDYATLLESAVRRVEQATGLAPVIVAHSMGGLVVRAWLRSRDALGDGPAHLRVARVLTLGTPHRGTWMARVSMAPNGRQMRRGSDWMTALTGAEPADRAALFTCWWSGCDQIVFPPPTGLLPGGEDRRLDSVGHIALACHEAIWADLLERLES